MAKVINTIGIEDGMNYNDVFSFRTLSHVGIWDHNSEMFAVINEVCNEFYIKFIDIDIANTLEKLDKEVYEFTNEHILEVFGRSNCRIKLEVEE